MRLGEVITLNKDTLIEIEHNTQYTIAGVQSYGKGILNKRTVTGHELTMKKYKVIKPNQLMWCKVDTKNGGFGITTIDHEGSLASTNMALADIDIEKADPQFIELLFRNKWFYETINSKSKGTTNRKYLKPKEVCDLIDIPNLTLQEQLDFVKLYNKITDSGLKNEVENQKILIKKLRQAILQEAVEGKLTLQWREANPSVESASELLKRIEAEKQQLITEKKIKKEKPLHPMEDEDKPYDLPEGWVWCRLNQLTEVITKGSSPKWQGVQYVEEGDGGILFVTSENVGSYKLIWKKKKYVEAKFNDIEPRSILKRNDLLMNIVGGSIGRTAIYDIDDLANINQAVTIIRLLNECNYSYFLHFFNSPICISYMYDKQVDNARPNLSMGSISKFMMPLPPLKEQLAIVEKANSLMALCDELEQQIDNSQTQIEQLMQSCLKEVFEQESN